MQGICLVFLQDSPNIPNSYEVPLSSNICINLNTEALKFILSVDFLSRWTITSMKSSKRHEICTILLFQTLDKKNFILNGFGNFAKLMITLC